MAYKSKHMKRITLILLMLVSMTAEAQVPTWNEWFRQKKTQRRYLIRQIIALKVYLEFLKKGYEIVDNGLRQIGDIKDKSFKMDTDYITSLRDVSAVVKNSPDFLEITICHQKIAREWRIFQSYIEDGDNLSPKEKDNITQVHQNVLSKCGDAMDELTIVITPTHTEMTDDQRLLRLEKIHSDMQEHYMFTKRFIETIKLMVLQRAKSKSDYNVLKKYYDLQIQL